MNDNKYLENSISSLKLNKAIIDILKENQILKVNDLWIKNRTYLKSIGLTDSQIKDIIIKLELIGLDLNKRKNK